MVQINRLQITPSHPIFVENKWCYPSDLVNVGDEKVKIHSFSNIVLYNFVLSEGHTLLVDGISCVTLGHEFTDNLIVAHPYYGTRQVIQDLMKRPGWEEGYIRF